MTKDEFIQEAYLNIAVNDELANECLRRKTICQKLVKLINSDLGEEFLDGCEDFKAAMQKFELKYGFLI
ncbi:hypothetical protein [Campylobacter sp. RM16190]|uniref:hypothetical protein n=1 Tax=Campylobacter sp. RM16190 TaxID=1705727 RepID=UPI001472D136|nr:hypothetical protein [Campylobacter sp. RM16190]